MKNITLYFFIATLILVSAFVWQKQQQVPVASSTNPELIPVKEALLELQIEKAFVQLNEEDKKKRIYEVLEKLPPEYKTLKRQYQIAMSALPHITFYGRIIDQYNMPVSGASVFYIGTNAYLSAGGGRGQVMSDENGYFEIDTEGASLELGGIGHPEIDGVYHMIGSSRKRDASFVSYDDPQGRHPNWRNYTKKESAYLIRAWRLGEYEGSVSGNESLRIDSDGSIYTLNLDKSKREMNIVKGEGKGQFRISCQRRHMESNRDYGDWSLSLSPINGGLLETDDLYMNIAPESGYQPSFKVDMKKEQSDYKHTLENKRFYFKTNNGQEYGSMVVQFQPFYSVSRDICNIRMTYKINPTGSRNLELKRENTSLPQFPTSQKLG